jgi:DNA repair exonuclease SbcCD ATPase subunit
MSQSLAELRSEARLARQKLDRRSGEARALLREGKTLQTSVDELKKQIDVYDKAARVLASVGEGRQEQAQHQIESLVTRGLQTIFGEEYSFAVRQSITGKGRTPVVEFILQQKLANGEILEVDAFNDCGGGISSTVGFMLKLVVLLLSKKRGSVMFIDEAFAFVSSNYIPALAEFLRELVDKTGLQVLLVTHIGTEEFLGVADKRFQLERVNGMTKVLEI